MTKFPRALTPVNGPFPAEKISGAAAGMGLYGDATRALVDAGLVQPDLITGMALALISHQPRKPRPDGERKASGTAGKIWVRERYTIHRPLAVDDAWEVRGESTGTYVRKGRSYSTTRADSLTSAGERFATNLTTGLFSYRPDPSLPDSFEGLAIEDTPAPEPDWGAAAENPHVEALAAAEVGQVFGGTEVAITLAMMAARDTDNPDNPIHSDPEEARKAGLGRPIAGGSHVAAFALEAVMQAFGTESLLHGANFDFRWKAPTEDGSRIIPTATVVAAQPDRVVFDLQVDLVDGPTAMVGSLVVTLPR
jgi:acyl dehydratase